MRRNHIISLGLLLLAFTLWMFRLHSLDLWGDELYTAAITSKPLLEMLRIALIDAVHPPLYYLLIKAMRSLAGDTALTMRMPSIWATVLGMAMLARLAREVSDKPTAHRVLLLSICNPFLYWYAREMRMYALLFGLTAALALLLALAVRGHRWAWGAQGVVVAAMLNTHYLSAFALLPSLAFIAAERRLRRHLGPCLIAYTLGGLTSLPWLYAWLNREPKYLGIGWITELRLADVPRTLRTIFFSGSETWPWVVVLGGAGALAAWLAALARPDPRRWKPWLLLSWALPWISIILISLTMLPIHVDRYLIITMPALLLWQAQGLSGLRTWIARVSLTALCLGGIIGILGMMTQPIWQRPQWEAAITQIESLFVEGDVVLSNSPHAQPAGLYYAPTLPAFNVLYARDVAVPQTSQPKVKWEAGHTAWMVWEHYMILKHFPPSVSTPQDIAQALSKDNDLAARLWAHREGCQVYRFRHIEVWQCQQARPRQTAALLNRITQIQTD